jgi:hypothetical protein
MMGNATLKNGGMRDGRASARAKTRAFFTAAGRVLIRSVHSSSQYGRWVRYGSDTAEPGAKISVCFAGKEPESGHSGFGHFPRPGCFAPILAIRGAWCCAPNRTFGRKGLRLLENLLELSQGRRIVTDTVEIPWGRNPRNFGRCSNWAPAI